MTFRSASAAIGLAMILAGGASFGALAQDGQKPPVAEQQADQKPAEQPKCITSNTDFKQKGNSPTYQIELVNSCDMRLKCTIDAFVIGARGQAQGHGTLILAAAPKGQTTSKTYVMKVKSLGGMANVSHSCKAF
jgi:hypothetical protein